LGTCIALELCCAAGAIGGVWIGVGRGTEIAGAYLTSRDAAAATPSSRTEPADQVEPFARRLPAAKLVVAAPTPPPTVFDYPDDVLLEPLAATPVTRMKLNHGGTSLSLRLDFASGARAAFKPEQTHPQSDPRREIAAYRLDRWLGIGHVAPAKAARFKTDDLIAASDLTARDYTAARITDEGIQHAGQISGVVSWWIPEIKDAYIGGIPVDEDRGQTIWQSYLHPGIAIPHELAGLIAQLDSCVVFDVLIDNADRWTGSNTKASPDNKILYFMDNTLSFSVFTLGHEANLIPLHRIEVFSRALITRLRALRYETLVALMGRPGGSDDNAGLGPLLSANELHAVIARRDHLLQYVDRVIEQYGEAAVLSLP
jgi:hypothetical protein